eukprot:scpid57561/ scgid29216/ 
MHTCPDLSLSSAWQSRPPLSSTAAAVTATAATTAAATAAQGGGPSGGGTGAEVPALPNEISPSSSSRPIAIATQKQAAADYSSMRPGFVPSNQSATSFTNSFLSGSGVFPYDSSVTRPSNVDLHDSDHQYYTTIGAHSAYTTLPTNPLSPVTMDTAVRLAPAVARLPRSAAAPPPTPQLVSTAAAAAAAAMPGTTTTRRAPPAQAPASAFVHGTQTNGGGSDLRGTAVAAYHHGYAAQPHANHGNGYGRPQSGMDPAAGASVVGHSAYHDQYGAQHHQGCPPRDFYRGSGNGHHHHPALPRAGNPPGAGDGTGHVMYVYSPRVGAGAGAGHGRLDDSNTVLTGQQSQHQQQQHQQ